MAPPRPRRRGRDPGSRAPHTSSRSCRRGWSGELELERFGYAVSLTTPDYFVPFPDGTSLTLWGDVRRDAANIAKLNAHAAAAYPAFERYFDRYFDRVARLLRDLLFVVRPNLRLGDLPGWLRTVAKVRGWRSRDLAALVRRFTMSAADFLDEWFEDERVKGARATQAIIGAWCGPMTPDSAYVLMHHWIGDGDPPGPSVGAPPGAAADRGVDRGRRGPLHAHSDLERPTG